MKERVKNRIKKTTRKFITEKITSEESDFAVKERPRRTDIVSAVKETDN